MEIENPNTAEFVPLPRAFNFEYIPIYPIISASVLTGLRKATGRNPPRGNSVGITIRVKQHGQLNRGVFKGEWGFNTTDGMVILEVV